MVFKTPLILILIPVALLIVAFLKRRQKPATFTYSAQSLFSNVSQSWKVQLRWVPWMLRCCILILMIIALAGPRQVKEETLYNAEGIDIVLAIDTSWSMAALDFVLNNERVDRLSTVKNVVSEFVQKRSADRLGLIAFAGVAYTVCPLTTDYGWLNTNLDRLELGLIEDGTAIGSALTSSIARLKNSDAKSKVVILLTDGENNAGTVGPLDAARAAQTFGIKVYTIGAGTIGNAPVPVGRDFYGKTVYRNRPVVIDEATLKEIAKITDGKYYRATDTESLKEIYNEIDRLEKTKIEQLGYYEYTELFDKFLLAALLLLLIEVALTQTIFLKIP